MKLDTILEVAGYGFLLAAVCTAPLWVGFTICGVLSLKASKVV